MIRHACRPYTRGLTLLELLVTLIVLLTVVTVGIPAFSQLVERTRLITATNEFVTALHHARSEAVHSARPVTLCVSVDGQQCADTGTWEAGWLVFRNPDLATQPAHPDDVLRSRRGPFGRGVEIRGNTPVRQRITYAPLGHTRRLSGALQMGTLRLCNGERGRAIIINRAGRPRLASEPCTPS